MLHRVHFAMSEIHTHNVTDYRVRVIVFSATFNNISAISWRSIVLVEENRSSRGKPPTCRKSLINFIT